MGSQMQIRPHLLAGLARETGNVDLLPIDSDVPVVDQLPRCRHGGRKAQAEHCVVQPHLQQLQQDLARRALLLPARVEGRSKWWGLRCCLHSAGYRGVQQAGQSLARGRLLLFLQQSAVQTVLIWLCSGWLTKLSLPAMGSSSCSRILPRLDLFLPPEVGGQYPTDVPDAAEELRLPRRTCTEPCSASSSLAVLFDLVWPALAASAAEVDGCSFVPPPPAAKQVTLLCSSQPVPCSFSSALPLPACLLCLTWPGGCS